MAAPRNLSVESNIDEEPNFKPSWASPFGEKSDSEDRHLSRRRSVECSATKITIPDTEPNQDHTVYIIRVYTPLRVWVIKRRYRDFYYLDKELRKYYPNIQFPSLPPKRYLRSSSDPEIVDQRKEQLEQYLNGLVTAPLVWARNDFVLFLNDETNIMTFIWNFERMKKLQEMLNTMKMSNTSEASKLTSDLAVARKQVQVLQARMSQMEMIFLQQATGMATKQLPSSVLRSLSGIESSVSNMLRGELTEEHASLYTDKEKEKEGDAEAELPVEEVMRALSMAQDGSTMSPDKTVNAEDARAYAVSLQLQEAIRLSNELLTQKVDISLSPPPEKSRRQPSADYHRRQPSADYHPSRKSPIMSAKFVSAPSESKFHAAALPTEGMVAGKLIDSNWISLLAATVDVIVDAISPTPQILEERYHVFKYVRDLVCKTLGVQIFPTGSLCSHTFLPDGGLDCTAFVPKVADDGWFVKINEALCWSAFGEGDGMTVSNVSFVNDDIKMIHSSINGISVTISTNQLTAIYSEALVERINAFVGKSNLFKRSLLLLKAWFANESARYTIGGASLLGSKDSLSTWSLIVLMIYIFNINPSLTHPLQAVGQFFAYYSGFDWTNLFMSVKGPAFFRAEDNTLVYITDSHAKQGRIFPDEIFDFYRGSNGDYTNWSKQEDAEADSPAPVSPMPQSPKAGQPAQPAEEVEDVYKGVDHNDCPRVHPDYCFGEVNLINPIDRSQNLLDILEVIGLDSFVSALHEGYKHYQSVCEEVSQTNTGADDKVLHEKCNKLIRKLFANTCNKAGIETYTKMVAHASAKVPADVFKIASKDLQFALSYGQLALGGKVDKTCLLHLIVIILNKKGAMPVGEVGKNLQALLCCDNLSVRLKQQFGGLKKAIEKSDFAELRMGTEHPFNPVVTMQGESPMLLADAQDIAEGLTFGHASFLFTPYSISLQLQAQAAKDAQMLANKHNRQHKPKPYVNYNVNNNAHSGSYSPNYHPQENMAQSPYGSYPPPYMGMPMGYNGPQQPYMEGSQNSPKRPTGAHSPPGPMYYQAHGGPPMGPAGMMPPMGQPGMHSMPMPIAIPGAYPGMPMFNGGAPISPMAPMFPPPPMGYGGPAGPPYYQMHNSLPGSLNNSYGHQHMMNMSHSPTNQPMQMQQHPQQPQPHQQQQQQQQSMLHGELSK